MVLKGGSEGATWQWQGNEFTLISVVSAVQCQLLPPGGHFGNDPVF